MNFWRLVLVRKHQPWLSTRQESMKNMCNKHHKHPRKGRGIQSNCKFVTPFFGLSRCIYTVFARILSEELLLVNDVFRSCLLWCLIQPDPSWPSSHRWVGYWKILEPVDRAPYEIFEAEASWNVFLMTRALGGFGDRWHPGLRKFGKRENPGQGPSMKPKQMDLVLNQLHVKNLGISRSLIGAHCWASGRVFEASSEMKSKQNAKLEKQTVLERSFGEASLGAGQERAYCGPGSKSRMLLTELLMLELLILRSKNCDLACQRWPSKKTLGRCFFWKKLLLWVMFLSPKIHLFFL